MKKILCAILSVSVLLSVLCAGAWASEEMPEPEAVPVEEISPAEETIPAEETAGTEAVTEEVPVGEEAIPEAEITPEAEPSSVVDSASEDEPVPEEEAVPEEEPVPETAPAADGKYEDAATLEAGVMTTATVDEVKCAYFCFVPQQSGVYRIESFCDDNALNPACWLFDGEETQLSYNDDGVSGKNFRLEYGLVAGNTYYLEVGFDSFGRAGEYPIRASLLSAFDELPSVVPGEQFDVVVPDRSTYFRGGGAYFRFVPSESGTYHFESLGTGGDPYCVLHDETWKQLSYTITGENQNFSWDYILEAGKNYFLEFTYLWTNAGGYPVLVTKRNPLEDAQPILPGETAVSENAIYSFFRFTPEKTDNYQFSCEFARNFGEREWTLRDDADRTVEGVSLKGTRYIENRSYVLEAGRTYLLTLRTQYAEIKKVDVSVLHSYEYNACVYCGEKLRAESEEGEDPSWVIEGDTLVISGTGTAEPGDWEDIKEGVRTVVVEEGITALGDELFGYFSSLAKVTLPESLTAIGAFAFDACSKLPELTIPAGVTEIGEQAFYGCESLTEITIPSGVTELADRTFESCENLEQVTLPEGLKKVGSYVFDNCSGLKELELPESVTKIGSGVFSDCYGLTQLTIPAGVTVIEDNTFSGCTGLTSVKLPEGLTEIGSYAFDNCSGLKELELPESVTEIGGAAFTYSGIEVFVIPAGVTEIQYDMFYGSALKTVTIPLSVTKIDYGAFADCENLTDIWYGGSLGQWWKLGVDEEEYQTALKTATIHCADPSEEYLSDSWGDVSWSLDIHGNLTITGSGATQSYIKERFRTGVWSPGMPLPVWSPFQEHADRISTVYIDEGVTYIGTNLFYNCDISDVYYGGTQDMWQYGVTIDEGNEPLTNAALHVNSLMPGEATPTPEPTAEPTTAPTAVPTVEPTAAPTTEPTAVPTTEPTTQPTVEPTAAPTTEPTAVPTTEPTTQPTTVPTEAPTTQPTSAPEITRGDCNGDGKVNRQDRIYLARALAGWEDYPMPDEAAADLTGDGKINRQDRIQLARYLAGWEGYTLA